MRAIASAVGLWSMRYIGSPRPCSRLTGGSSRRSTILWSTFASTHSWIACFKTVKHAIQEWVDANVDHKMVLRRDDPPVSLLQGLGEPMYLMDHNPTAEAMARILYDVAAQQRFPVRAVKFWESPTSYATY